MTKRNKLVFTLRYDGDDYGIPPERSTGCSWYAHCLTFNNHASADTMDVALGLALEGAELCLAHAEENGIDPDSLRAPAEDWAEALK